VLAESFDPVAGIAPRVLVLGTMPGQTSLRESEYYAHKRNAFWPIVLSVINNTEPDYHSAQKMPYAERIQQLKQNHIALWDVLANCERPGSLDSAIVRHSEVANPIMQWLEMHRSIQCVCFNGKTAQRLFKRHVASDTHSITGNKNVEFIALPSTSAAIETSS